MVSQHVLDGGLSADGLEVAADSVDRRVVEVAVLDLGDVSLADADALGQLGLCEAGLFAQLAQAVGADPGEHPLLVRLDDFPVHRVLGHEVFITQCHLDHSPFRVQVVIEQVVGHGDVLRVPTRPVPGFVPGDQHNRPGFGVEGD